MRTASMSGYAMFRSPDHSVWEVTNDNGYQHNFHVDDVQFQVLTVDARTSSRPPFLAVVRVIGVRHGMGQDRDLESSEQVPSDDGFVRVSAV